MGASFRNIDQILGLAGCDRLTISPNLLEELRGMTGDVVRQLGVAPPKGGIRPLALDEVSFRWQFNQDAMATEKLAEGIRGFAKDTETLCSLLRNKLLVKYATVAGSPG